MLISLCAWRTNQICSAPPVSAAIPGAAAAASAAPAAATNIRRDSRGPPVVVIFFALPHRRFLASTARRALATFLHLRRRAEYAPALTFFERLCVPNNQLILEGDRDGRQHCTWTICLA